MAKVTQYQIEMREEVSAQLRAVNAKIAETNTRMAQMSSAGSKAFDVIKNGAAGLVAIRAFGILKDGATEAVKAFAEYEKSLNQLQAQLKVSGSELGLSFNQLKSIADTLQGSTGIDDAEILKSISLLQTFQNVRGDVFKQTIEQAANLSTVFGDIDTATKQLGAALDNPAENLDKLKKASIYFTDAQKEEIKSLVESGSLHEAQAIVLAKVKEKYDGLAVSLNQGMSGSIANLSNAWDDFLKVIGKKVSIGVKPAIDGLTGALNEWMAADVVKLSEAQKSGVAKLKGYYNALNSVRNEGQKSGVEKAFTDQLNQLSATGYSLDEQRSALELLVGKWAEVYEQQKKDTPKENWRLLDSYNTLENLRAQLNVVEQISSVSETIQGKKADQAQADANSQAKSDSKSTELIPKPAQLKPSDLGETFIGAPKEMKIDFGVTYMGLPLNQAVEVFKKDLGQQLKEAADEVQKQLDSIQPATNALGSLYSTFTDIQKEQSQQRIDALKSEFDVWNEKEQDKINLAKSNGETTAGMEQDYLNKKYAKEQEIRKLESAAKKKAFEAEKASKLASIVSETARGVVASLPNIPLSVLVGAIGATELALVASQPTPAFAQGGMVYPTGDPQGRTIRVAEREPELIIPGSKIEKWLAPNSSQGGVVQFFLIADPETGTARKVTKEFVRQFWDVDKLLKRDFEGVM